MVRSTQRPKRLRTKLWRARLTITASDVYQAKSKIASIAAISSVAGSTGAPASMNCGNSATKKTASLGLDSEVTTPSRNGRVEDAARLHRSPLRRSDCTPIQISTQAPTSLSAR